MYQAPVLTVGIIAVYIWRCVAKGLEENGSVLSGCRGKLGDATRKVGKGLRVPLWAHYYTPLYLMLAALFIGACSTMHTDVMQPSHYLDPVFTEAFVHNVMNTSKIDDAKVFALWKKEASLETKAWVKYFSFTAPFWVALTFVVCIYHTWEHVKEIRDSNKKLCECVEHDRTIAILALPLVYGLMSFKSVIRCWQIVINHVPVAGNADASVAIFSGYVERKTFLTDMYESNFMVGDIYETIALVIFGHLVSGVIANKIGKMREHVTDALNSTSVSKENSERIQSNLQQLVTSLRVLTVMGIELFAYSCALQGAYMLTVTTLAFEFQSFMPSVFSHNSSNPGTMQKESVKEAASNFFYGCAMASSCAAIGNVMVIEHDFEELLEEFKPKAKFWGTKILVTLACLQSSLLAIVCTTWSTVEIHLFYASVLCFECFLISLAHMKSWDAKESWYKEDKSELSEALLA